MTASIFKKKSIINVPAKSLFAWHARPGALERLSPPWDPVTVISGSGGIRPGTEVLMVLHAGPFPFKWHAKHTLYEEGKLFKDIQIKGPFRSWEHTHKFVDTGSGSCEYIDEIEYTLPFHPAGTRIGTPAIEKKLERIFEYRHKTVAADIHDHINYGLGSKTILISGASGLIGKKLTAFLSTGGHRVIRLVRRKARRKDEVQWNPYAGFINIKALESIGKIDVAIHLSGENIGKGRWTGAKKKRIIESRVKSTGFLAQLFSRLPSRPELFLNASAIGYYGDRKNEITDETSGPGTDFISHVCVKWEKAASPAETSGIRTVFMRIGVVLTPEGGALKRLLPVFRAGLGGKIGSGKQFVSWIAIDDVLGAVLHIMADDSISGPVNLCAPEPVRFETLAGTIGRVLKRPVVITIPEWAVLSAFGQMAKETILSSTRVVPEKLMRTGYSFRFPVIEQAIRHVLGKES